MKVEIKNYQGRIFKEWSCCGQIWQLLLLLGPKECNTWNPVCLICQNKEKRDVQKT